MRLHFAVPIVLVLSLVVPTAFAQDRLAPVLTPTKDPQAVAILEQSISAMGESVPSDSTATGEITIVAGSTTQTGTIRILTRSIDQTLESIQIPGAASELVYSRGLASTSDGTHAKLLQAELTVTSQSAIFPLPLLAGALQNPDMSLTFIGQEAVDDIQTYHIQLLDTFASDPQLQPLAQLSRRDIWVDVTTNLPHRLSYVVQEGRGAAPRIPMQIAYAGYKNEGGVLYPLAIQKSMNGVLWETITIKNVALNTGSSDSNFLLQ